MAGAVIVTTQVAGQMLNYAMISKFVATLREAFRKVELISTFRNREPPGEEKFEWQMYFEN